jgi:hypothetical protein
MIYGPWGAGKSFLALDLCLHLATGTDWSDHKTHRPYRIAYTAGEGVFGIRQRVIAWAQHHHPENVDNFRLVPIMPLFGNDGDLKEYAEDLKDWAPQLIVVDTVAHGMAGLDENNQKDAGIFMARCAELRNMFRASILVIHHTGKDENKGARGSTVLPAAMDTVFEVSKPREGEAILTMKKQKDAAGWPTAQGFRATQVGKSLVFTPASVSRDTGAMQDNNRMSVMLEVLQITNGLNTKPLAVEVARASAPGADNLTLDKLAASCEKWLQRLAKSPEGDKWLLHRGEGRTDPHLWGLTESEEGNDDGD